MELNYLLQGIALGAAAGLLPGPVMMFSLAQVIKSSVWSGFKVQLGATFMDIVRILITFFLFSLLPQNETLIGVISFVGGLFLLYMAYGNFTYKPQLQLEKQVVTNPLAQGMLGNILNSSAYIFWLTVGGPIIIQASRNGANFGGISFALGFLISITAIGGIIALLAGRIKVYLASKYYTYVIRGLGLVIVFFALLFFKQAYLYISR